MNAALRPLRQGARALWRHAAARLGPQSRRGGPPRLWVLMYHRILPAQDARARHEEPGMMVTPETFDRHLAWVREHFEPVRLRDWVAWRDSGRPLPQRACAITFDDGWRDNHEFALPLLRRHQMPATVFAVSDMIGTQRAFWPNRLSRVLSQAGASAATAPGFAWLRELCGDDLRRPVDAERRAAIINICKALSDDQLADHLARMEAECGQHDPQPDLMSWEQLRDLQASGLVDIGSHTRSHARLVASLPAARMAAEIRDSRRQLEQALDRPVDLFCYPNGDYTEAAEDLVRETYRAAVTTRRGINDAATPLSTLTRIGIHEDISRHRTAFLARLSGWSI